MDIKWVSRGPSYQLISSPLIPLCLSVDLNCVPKINLLFNVLFFF